jgi:colanic acid biosynthesis glycosyl transferase WcaI
MRWPWIRPRSSTERQSCRNGLSLRKSVYSLSYTRYEDHARATGLLESGSHVRVQLFNQYFPPDRSATAAITSELVAALVNRGHEVDVVCGRPSYGCSERLPFRLVTRSRRDEASISRIGSTALDRKSRAGRMANYLSYILGAGVYAVRIQRPDLVVAQTDPPLAVLVGAMAARRRPLVYVVRDLHPEAAVAAGWAQPGRFVRAWDGLHSAVMRRADVVVGLGEDMAERICAKGVRRHRVAVIHDGARPPVGSPNPAAVEQMRSHAEFVALHAGNLGMAGAWETLARAKDMLDRNTTLLFVGDGAGAANLSRRGLRVVPFRPDHEIPSVMAAGDIQIVTLRSGLEGLVVPSKLYTALAHGRPILAVVPECSEVARIVERWKCGVVCNPDDPHDVASAIRWLKDRPEELAAMSSQSAAAGRFYDRDACLGRLVSIIESAGRGQVALGESEAFLAGEREVVPLIPARAVSPNFGSGQASSAKDRVGGPCVDPRSP